MRTIYEQFGAKPQATKEELRQRYYLLMKKYHPDKCKGDNKIAQEINKVYSVLSDDVLRKQYDKELEVEASELKKQKEREDREKAIREQAEALKKKFASRSGYEYVPPQAAPKYTSPAFQQQPIYSAPSILAPFTELGVIDITSLCPSQSVKRAIANRVAKTFNRSPATSTSCVNNPCVGCSLYVKGFCMLPFIVVGGGLLILCIMIDWSKIIK